MQNIINDENAQVNTDSHFGAEPVQGNNDSVFFNDEEAHGMYLDLVEDGIFSANVSSIGQDVASSSSHIFGERPPPHLFAFSKSTQHRLTRSKPFAGRKRQSSDTSTSLGRPLKFSKSLAKERPPNVFHFAVLETGAPTSTPQAPEASKASEDRQLPARNDKGRAKEGKTFMDSAGE